MAGGLNLYGYAGGNPVMRFDPYGLDWQDTLVESAVLAVVGIGTIALAAAIAPPAAVGLVAAAASGWVAGQVLAVGGLALIQYSEGGWCNVDKDLLWMLAEEGAWMVAGGTVGLLAKRLRDILRARKVETDKYGDIISREPKSLQDQMTKEAAMRGEGDVIIENLGNEKYKGWDKVEVETVSNGGKKSTVHYVRDPITGNTDDFKFKKHSTDYMHRYEQAPREQGGIR